MNLFKTNKTKTNSLRFGPTNKKRRIEVFYFDFGNPFLYAKLYQNNLALKEQELTIEKGQIENGKILNVSMIIDQLKQLTKDRFTIDLIVSTSMAFDSIISLPKISSSKVEQLKRKELKNSFDKYKNSYHLIEDCYSYSLGTFFIEHFISNNIIENWQEIAKGANAKLSTVTLFGNYLYNDIKTNHNVDIKENQNEINEENNIEEIAINKKGKKKAKKGNNKKKSDKLYDFALIYVHKTMATFVLSSYDQLSLSYSFEFSSAEDLIKKFVLVIGKHEIEFEKKKITDILVDSDVSLNLEKYLKDIKIHDVHFKMFDGKKDEKEGDISLK